MRSILKRGFTLIELLIGVLIIAILAAIAVPNYLEFQTRAKIARLYSDLRSVMLSLEAYNTDNDAYPIDLPGNWPPNEYSLTVITTPIAYISTLPQDPFRLPDVNPTAAWYDYGSGAGVNRLAWSNDFGRYGFGYFMVAMGPDNRYDWGLGTPNSGQPWTAVDMSNVLQTGQGSGTPNHINKIYEPTNGTVSSGDIWITNRKIHNAQ